MFLRQKRDKYWEIVKAIRDANTGKNKLNHTLYLGTAETIYRKMKKRKKNVHS